MTYTKTLLQSNKWIITEAGRSWLRPAKACTFAFDTETLVYLDDEVRNQEYILEALKDCTQEEKRSRLRCEVWAWQAYDEVNGFFMTNDFLSFCNYCAVANYKYGWCYNATFDFSQIDYQILSNSTWTPHEHKGRGNTSQPWTYESLHNNAGARYCYKLWIPYRKHGRGNDRHEHVHCTQINDFMKLMSGGLASVLEALKVVDNDGVPVRKLKMDYQAVNTNNLTDEEIAYCCNDVKGLYFAVKTFNAAISEQSCGECSIFGKDTNIMTAGGFAKRELLRSLYPNTKPKYRIERYQREHPLTPEQDKWLRDNHLYRGGLCVVNPRYKGKLLTRDMFGGETMQRYDVNSEYPYAMASIRDLIGRPVLRTYEQYLAMRDKDEYECIMIIEAMSGELKPGMVPVYYDPFRRDFTGIIDETGKHLIFRDELDELMHWYDIEYKCDYVLIVKRGDYAYRPFIEANYELKSNAPNKVIKTSAKLKLNSSYGKLAERSERGTSHYEINEDTGAVHLVQDGIKTDAKSMLNVIVGAKVTSYARCYILSQIRATCDNVARQFVYIDTDSIHAFARSNNCDPVRLGALKCEAECDAVKYIAPKTYIDIEHVEGDGTVAATNVEAHTKGINVSAIYKHFDALSELTLSDIDKAIDYGVKYQVLQALNVRGGKVLVPCYKYLARPELAPNERINTGYDGAYYNEL